MTKQDKLKLLKARYAILQGRGDKNIKSPGTCKKIMRQIRGLEK